MSDFKVKDAQYDPAREALQIEFENGTKYQYHDVPAMSYYGFINADYQIGYITDFLNKNYEFYQL
ncbi:KTSC domain-containing protein [Clostridiaceae bacterium M8S5]|nr:KTSC domain-containing protein [Clostridiaceae bacterium M8S5]